MALNRTVVNAWLDDDGSNTVGEVISKSDITGVLDTIDAEIARLDAAFVTHTGGALTVNALVVGAGAADVSALASLGTTATVLHGNAAGPPTYAAVAQSEVTNLVADLAAKAPIASPTLTGTPAAPTAAVGTNTTQIATTAFVQAVPGPVRCVVSNSGAQNVTTATVVAVTFDTESFDAAGFHSTVTNTSRLTVPSGGAGTYLVVGEVTWAGSVAGTLRQVGISVNGTAVDTIAFLPTVSRPQVLTVITVAVSDYIEMTAYQDSGVTMTVGSGAAAFMNRLTLIKVS